MWRPQTDNPEVMAQLRTMRWYQLYDGVADLSEGALKAIRLDELIEPWEQYRDTDREATKSMRLSTIRERWREVRTEYRKRGETCPGDQPKQPPRETRETSKTHSGGEKKTRKEIVKARFDLLKSFWLSPAKLNSASQATWCYLWSIANSDGIVSHGHRQIADARKCAISMVQKTLDKLERYGYLIVIAKGHSKSHRATKYQIVVPTNSESNVPL